MAKNSAHPGFKAIQAKMAGEQGESMAEAGAELASATRKASPAAKRKNPRLKKVKGKKKAKNFDPNYGSFGGM